MRAKQTLLRTLQLRSALSIVWESNPLWMTVNTSLLVIQGLLPLASLYLMKLILDAVVAQLDSDSSTIDFRPLAILIALAGGVAFLSAAANIVTRLTNEAQGEAVTDHVHTILHMKSIEVDLEYYERPEYYDKLHRAQQEALYRPIRIVNDLMLVIQNGVLILAIAGLLLSLHWAVSLILFVTAVPGVLVRFRYANKLFLWQQKSTPAERHAWYYDWILVNGEYAKEMRLFNLGPLFIRRFQELRQQLRHERLQINFRRSLAELITQFSSTTTMFGVYAFIAYQTLRGTITLGDLVMYYQAFQRGQAFLSEMLRSLAGLYENSLFLASLDDFLNLKSHVVTPSHPQPVPHPICTGITFHDVSFSYPGRANHVLKHISLTIHPGEVVALVGENGSGKTTLVKLLCRLYDPTEGKISIDDTDLCDVDPLNLRRSLSIIFQDYLHYDVTAQENIWFGNVELSPTSPHITTAAQKAGAHEVITQLPQGYQTILGKIFHEGQELSIGQWQKIALARAFLRDDSSIIVLDEPTSALDALAEYEIFTRFRELIGDRSALLISHRLSSVKMADHIYVLDKLTIAEHGTHDELMQHDGIYAKLFKTQAENYRLNDA